MTPSSDKCVKSMTNHGATLKKRRWVITKNDRITSYDPDCDSVCACSPFYIHQLPIGTFIVALLHDTFRKLSEPAKNISYFPVYWFLVRILIMVYCNPHKDVQYNLYIPSTSSVFFIAQVESCPTPSMYGISIPPFG